MKKALLFLFAISLPFMLSGCSSNTPASPKDVTPAPLSAASSAEAIKAGLQPITMSTNINIQNYAFSPSVLTVPVGAVVTWTNNDAAIHQIKSDSFNSAMLSNGQSFSFTFRTAGTFNYSCSIHPSMTGQIIVQ